MWLMSDTKVLILLAVALGLLAILTGREDYSLRGSIAMLGPAVAAVDGPDHVPVDEVFQAPDGTSRTSSPG
jgi:hypothetical protein